jgi:hypothetical protein
MLAAIRRMLADPEESWWVVDGALMALKFAPAKEIAACKPLIMPWTKHSDWWLRESSFMALSGLEKDDALYLEVVPALLGIMTCEYHTQPRARMVDHLERVLRSRKETSPAGRLIVAGLGRSVAESKIVAGERSAEGAYNVAEAAAACLQHDPATAVALAGAIRARFDLLGDGDLIRLLATPNANRENPPFGLHTALARQGPAEMAELTGILYRDYRPEVARRLKAAKDRQPELLDTLIDLVRLREPDAGWQPLGRQPPAERIWRFTSFDPQSEEDRLPLREKKRFRDIQLPDALLGWQAPGFDDSRWSQGRAPIGTGTFKSGGVSVREPLRLGQGRVPGDARRFRDRCAGLRRLPPHDPRAAGIPRPSQRPPDRHLRLVEGQTALPDDPARPRPGAAPEAGHQHPRGLRQCRIRPKDPRAGRPDRLLHRGPQDAGAGAGEMILTGPNRPDLISGGSVV